MNRTDADNWESVRSVGLNRYLLASLLTWGLPMFLIMTFALGRHRLTPLNILISALAWTIGGLVFGLLMWYYQEWHWQRLRSR